MQTETHTTMSNLLLDSPYARAVLADTPLGYWRLGEAAGTTVATDDSGNSHHLRYVNGAADGLGEAGATVGTASGCDRAARSRRPRRPAPRPSPLARASPSSSGSRPRRRTPAARAAS